MQFSYTSTYRQFSFFIANQIYSLSLALFLISPKSLLAGASIVYL